MPKNKFRIFFIKQQGYVRYEKVVIIFFVLLVITAILSFIDPLEIYRKQRDSKLLQSSSQVAKSVGDYRNSKGSLPWSISNSKSSKPGLAWTRVTDELIGVCANSDCTKTGPLASSLPPEFIESKVIRGETVDSIYLLKGYGEQDPTYICFLPASQEFRKKYQDLYKIDTNSKSVPLNPKQASCNDNVNWTDNNVCYICIVQ